MYCPAQFQELRLDVLHELIRTQPLATFVTQTAGGLIADHIPLYLRNDGSTYGTLVGHVARNNPIWQLAGQEILAIFHGLDCYISPSWYATKRLLTVYYHEAMHKTTRWPCWYKHYSTQQPINRISPDG